MTDRDRPSRGAREPDPTQRPRPSVKVTDRRGVRRPERATGVGREGAAPSEGSDRSDAPPASEEDRPQPAAEEQELEEARAKAAEYLDLLQRVQAEFENYRKRMLKEQTRAVDLASEGLVRRLLDVLDAFQLALASAQAKPDFDRFLRGVELVYAKLSDALRGEGLEAIQAKGKPFDPSLHEALGGDGAEGEPFVEDVLRPGYRLRGRVIRPAGVRVAHHQAEAAADPAAEAEAEEPAGDRSEPR